MNCARGTELMAVGSIVMKKTYHQCTVCYKSVYYYISQGIHVLLGITKETKINPVGFFGVCSILGRICSLLTKTDGSYFKPKF